MADHHVPTIDEIEAKKRNAHYETTKRLSDLDVEAKAIQERLQSIQQEMQRIQMDYTIQDARYDAQIELLKALEKKE